MDVTNRFACEDTRPCHVRFPNSSEACQGQSFIAFETTSEDSCTLAAPHAVPCYLNSENPLSRRERKRLRTQVKSQLEQVNRILSRVQAREMDIRMALELEGSSSKSAYEVPERRERLKGGVKRTSHQQGDGPAITRLGVNMNSRKLADMMRQCGTMLRKLRSHKFGWIFNEPVDVIKLNLPDYLTIIKHPMDLGTIQYKLDYQEYASPLEFAGDVRLTFTNAMTYNPKGHDVHHMAEVLLKIFETGWKVLDVKLKQLKPNDVKTMQSPPRLVEGGACTSMVQPSLSSIADISRVSNVTASSYLQHDMTFEQKQYLSELMEDLPPEKMGQVIEIIERDTPELKPENGELTIELDKLKNRALWELYSLLTEESRMSRQQDSGETTQMLPLSGGPKYSRAIQGVVKEGNTGEEDIDIGVDLPTMSFPPIDIERDGTARSKHSNSSSGSESSSSGSDTESSSDSDLDVDNAQSRDVKEL